MAELPLVGDIHDGECGQRALEIRGRHGRTVWYKEKEEEEVKKEISHRINSRHEPVGSIIIEWRRGLRHCKTQLLRVRQSRLIIGTRGDLIARARKGHSEVRPYIGDGN